MLQSLNIFSMLERTGRLHENITNTRYHHYRLFSGVSLFGALFVMIFLPETKGKSLEEIEKYFINKVNSN